MIEEDVQITTCIIIVAFQYTLHGRLLCVNTVTDLIGQVRVQVVYCHGWAVSFAVLYYRGSVFKRSLETEYSD